MDNGSLLTGNLDLLHSSYCFNAVAYLEIGTKDLYSSLHVSKSSGTTTAAHYLEAMDLVDDDFRRLAVLASPVVHGAPLPPQGTRKQV